MGVDTESSLVLAKKNREVWGGILILVFAARALVSQRAAEPRHSDGYSDACTGDS